VPASLLYCIPAPSVHNAALTMQHTAAAQSLTDTLLPCPLIYPRPCMCGSYHKATLPCSAPPSPHTHSIQYIIRPAFRRLPLAVAKLVSGPAPCLRVTHLLGQVAGALR
jgi:hypothetical protein